MEPTSIRAGRVEQLNLEYNDLRGELLSSLGDLDKLKGLSLDGNLIRRSPRIWDISQSWSRCHLSRNPIKCISTVLSSDLQKSSNFELTVSQLSGEIPLS